MKAEILLDSHVIAWLYAGMIEQLSQSAQFWINEKVVGIVAPIWSELADWHHQGYLRIGPQLIVADLQQRLGLELVETNPFDLARVTTEITWTGNNTDRQLVASSILLHLPLLTKDAQIHNHFEGAIW
ncbi:MAG: hypothetical protein MK135_03050 [Polyangiaceae bacterium]|nr:hypothetical protein [Polyangiaceae bacterium]